MKQFNIVRNFIVVALLGLTNIVNGQTFHPLAFDSIMGANPSKVAAANWYKDYVGERLQVTAPSIIAGVKDYTTANNGSGGAGEWGGVVTTPIVNVPIIMGSPDTFGCSSFSPGSMTGKIAVIWRGPLGGSACEFGYKALQAENAGAIACVIINEYPGEGPVGMGPGSYGASVTIPVFMIGNLDGIAISAQYNSLPAGTVKMTITPWGQSYQNDLGFVPGGYSIWHDYAIPASQLGSENPLAYKGIDGAFVANYGTHNATNVKLVSSLTFTPNGGSTSAPHMDSISLASFPVLDSIWAMYAPAEYDLTSISGPGRFDLTYTITSDSLDQFNADNSITHSFYASDSVFSKGRYDFVNKHPITTQYYRAGGNYIWGVPYYVSRGGSAAKNIQFSIAAGVGPLPALSVNFYIFKWIDGSFGAGSLDSAIETGELQLVGATVKAFDGTNDSSFQYFTTLPVTADTVTPTHYVQVPLDSNSWYVVAAELPATGSVTDPYFFLGCDGYLDFYPRAFGRKHFHNVTELWNPVIDTDLVSLRSAYQAAAWTSYVFSAGTLDIDSVVYHEQVGVMPNLALNVTPVTNVAVPTVKSNARFDIYPNPATEYINADIVLEQAAKTITYTIIDAHARVVSRETRSNIQKDLYHYSTVHLPAGNYYLVVTADNKPMFKKFTVVR